MATIALYAGQLNVMPELIKDMKQSVSDYKTELTALWSKTITINKSICDLEEVISSIQASTQIQEEKIESLDELDRKCGEFVEEVVRIDREVAEHVRKRKEEFYDTYSFLKPECEKNDWEKFKDGCKKVSDWCKDNWKSLAKILVTAVIIVGLGIATILSGGVLAVILAGAFWGALSGALIGGISGGIASVTNGGKFLEGFADGALSGAVSGAVTGAIFAGIGVAGSALGTFLGGSCKFAEQAPRILNALKNISKVTGVLSFGMDGFDTLAFVVGFFNPDSPLVALNQQLHSSALYNVLQVGINGLALLSSTAYLSMKGRMKFPPLCFVAGTLIMTTVGLVAIENIKAGDMVVATNPVTLETEAKEVAETYINETTELVHLTLNGEVITTTANHPFYVKGIGFVEAGRLQAGDELIDAQGKSIWLEDVSIEVVEKPVTVYNFQVEDFHTYHVGSVGVLVHNSNCGVGESGSNTHVPSINTQVVQHPEIKSPNQVKMSDVTNYWDDYLGSNQTNIHPRTGLVDNDRIFSADGTRSIRFGNHEMNSMGTTKFHFHQEEWKYDSVNDVMEYFNTLIRIKK